MDPRELHKKAVEGYKEELQSKGFVVQETTPTRSIHLTVKNNDGSETLYVIKSYEKEKGAFGAISFSVWQKVQEGRNVIFVIAKKKEGINFSKSCKGRKDDFDWEVYSHEHMMLLINCIYHSTKFVVDKEKRNLILNKYKNDSKRKKNIEDTINKVLESINKFKNEK